MTRINLIEPVHLCDQHLLAEYRELPRIVNKILSAVKDSKEIKTVEGKYRLGTGHVTFFHNKCKWLVYRFDKIFNELKRRGFNLTFYGWTEHEINLLRDSQYWDECHDGSYGWSPNYEETMINFIRVSKQMPDTPRYFKKQISDSTIL